jgi:hypothetical protein
MTFDENMTFDEVIYKICKYIALDTLENYIKARKLLDWAKEKFTEPTQCKKMGLIGGDITSYAGDLIAREYPKKEEFQPDNSDFEDEDDLEDEGDDPTITIRVGAGKDGKIEYISG